MYRSSLTLAFVVLSSTAGAASDLSSVYVAPGGIYAPSADVYVRPGPAYRQPPYAEPGYGYQQPSYGTPGPAYRAPASVHGEYGAGYAPQPIYVERAPASRGFVMIAMTVRRLGGAQRHPSPLRARDGWVLLSLYPSCVLSP